MDRTADLELALNWVIRRVEKQANESGHPLNEEERFLLRNLPSRSDWVSWAPDLGPPSLAPRNLNLERLFALGRAAYLTDRRANTQLPDWRFAFAVFTFNAHPMWGILRHAGLEERRPLADLPYLIGGGLLVVLGLLFAMVPLLLAPSALWSLFLSIGIGLASVAGTIWLYSASKRIQARRLEKEIERSRLAAHSVDLGTT